MRHESAPKFSNGAIGGATLFVNEAGASAISAALNVGDFRGGVLGMLVRHERVVRSVCGKALDGPEKIDGGGAGLREGFGDLRKSSRSLARGGGFAVLHAQRDTHRGGDADGWGAADDQSLDGARRRRR